MKKEIKVIIAIVLAVWFFVMGFELGSYKEKKAQSEINTVNPVVNSTAITTTTIAKANSFLCFFTNCATMLYCPTGCIYSH